MAGRFLQAAEKGDYVSLQNLVKSGINVNARDKDGKMALHLTSENNHENCVTFLIKNQAEINAKETTDGKTALILGSAGGFIQIVNVLVENKADINCLDYGGQSALYWAVTNNNPDIVRYLLENKADPELQENCYGNTALIHATNQELTPIVELLLLNGASINKTGNEGITALWAACKNNDSATVRVLLKYNPDVNIRSGEYQETPLNVACFAGHYNPVQDLLEYGCDIEKCSVEGATPLYFSSQEGHASIVSLLIEKGAKVNAADHKFLKTPLLCAAQMGHNNVLQILLNNGADIDHCNKENMNALYLASRFGHQETVSILLKSCADIECKASSGRTPLLAACKENYFDVVNMLLDAGANIDACSNDGYTGLHLAVCGRLEDLVKLLVSKKAKIFKNNDNKTPLDMAVEKKFDGIVGVLKSYNETLDDRQNGTEKDHTAIIPTTPSSALPATAEPQVSYRPTVKEAALQPTTPQAKLSAKHPTISEDSTTPNSAYKDDKNLKNVEKADFEKIIRLSLIEENVSNVMKKIDNRNLDARTDLSEGADVDPDDLSGIPKGASDGKDLKVSRPENDLSDEHLNHIANRVGQDWKIVAGFLGVGMSTIQKIIAQHESGAEKNAACNMLIHWRDGATSSMSDKRGILREALEEADRTDIVDMI